MSDVERLAERINTQAAVLKHGSLRFWGEWFGRPLDNDHRVVSCDVEENALRVRFNEGEILRVWSPRNAIVSPDTFKIMDADRVRWEWFYYGRPQIAANLHFMDFSKTEAAIAASTNANWAPLNLKPSAEHPAVEIV